MNQCVLNGCINGANHEHRGYYLCDKHFRDNPDKRLIDHLAEEHYYVSEKIQELELNLECERSTIETLDKSIDELNERIAEYQMQSRPIYDKIFDAIYSNRDQWYVKATVLALPLIPLAMAVHWMW